MNKQLIKTDLNPDHFEVYTQLRETDNNKIISKINSLSEGDKHYGDKAKKKDKECWMWSFKWVVWKDLQQKDFRANI